MVHVLHKYTKYVINPLNAELNPIRHLLALVGARHIVHVSRLRVKIDAITSTSPEAPDFQNQCFE
jgi:hypothetical protein